MTRGNAGQIEYVQESWWGMRLGISIIYGYGMTRVRVAKRLITQKCLLPSVPD